MEKDGKKRKVRRIIEDWKGWIKGWCESQGRKQMKNKPILKLKIVRKKKKYIWKGVNEGKKGECQEIVYVINSRGEELTREMKLKLDYGQLLNGDVI